MTLVGFTALSVEISTKVSTRHSSAASAVLPGAEDVVVDALDHVVLDDRHVLVRGRVIDVCTPNVLHDLAHAMLVVRVAQQRDEFDASCRVAHSASAARARSRRARARTSRAAPARRGGSAHDLAAQLRTDRAARAGHQDDLAADAGIEQRAFGGTGSRPSRSSASMSRTSSRRAWPETMSPIVGHGLHQQRQRLDGLENFLAPTAGLRRQREQHGGDAFVTAPGRAASAAGTLRVR